MSKSNKPGENDGRIDVFLKEDGLEAWGAFYPAAEGGAPFTQEYVEGLIKEHRLLYGLKKEAIDGAADKCNREKQAVRDVLMARGDAPVNETAEHLRLNPALMPDADSEGHDEAAENTRFVVVKKNQVLARHEPHKTGKAGKNVHGEEIPFVTADPMAVAGGENTRMNDNFLVAEIDGQLVQNGNVVSVQPKLEIKGPMGKKTGSIIFPGDVYIDGPISDGFKLYSGGSIVIRQTFDVSDAISKGDMTVAGGIIGRGEAQIKAGGNLKTKFIENCRVACRKTVTVSTEIINSRVFCLETVEASKGRILGGEIWAVNGVKAGALVKISGNPPKIHCGVDFATEQEKEKQNNTIRVLSAKLSKLRQMLEDPVLEDDKKPKLSELRERLEADQKKAIAAISDIMGSTVANEEATVEVAGDIDAGTLIEICQTALYVTKQISNVRIRLNKRDGKLETERLW